MKYWVIKTSSKTGKSLIESEVKNVGEAKRILKMLWKSEVDKYDKKGTKPPKFNGLRKQNKELLIDEKIYNIAKII